MDELMSHQEILDLIKASTSLAFDDALEYQRADYKLFKFRMTGFPENQIKQLMADEVRIGWLFPVHALLSSEHDFVDNPHFLRYALVCIEIVAEQNKQRFRDGDARELSDCEDDDVVYACLHSPSLGCMNDHSIELALLAVGLIPHRPEVSIRGQMSFSQCAIDEGEKLRISATDEIEAPEYIFGLFSAACSDGFPVTVRFFFLYQVIEWLLEHVFELEIKKFKETICSEDLSPQDLRAAVDQIQSHVSERKRFRKLVESFQVQWQSPTQLSRQWAARLKQRTRFIHDSSSFSDVMYALRNILFHRLRDFSDADVELLEGTIDEMTIATARLVSGFSKNMPEE